MLYPVILRSKFQYTRLNLKLNVPKLGKDAESYEWGWARVWWDVTSVTTDGIQKENLASFPHHPARAFIEHHLATSRTVLTL